MDGVQDHGTSVSSKVINPFLFFLFLFDLDKPFSMDQEAWMRGSEFIKQAQNGNQFVVVVHPNLIASCVAVSHWL